VHEDNDLVTTGFQLKDEIVASRQSLCVVFEELEPINAKPLERAVEIGLFLKASRAGNDQWFPRSMTVLPVPDLIRRRIRRLSGWGANGKGHDIN